MEPNFNLEAKAPISKAFRQLGIHNFQEACHYIQKLPYKRISDKTNLFLLLEEQRGTCSSKHAILKKLAEENQFDDLQLIIGIYKMNPENTRGLKSLPHNLEYIPEAHAYLMYNNQRLDYTREGSTPVAETDLLEETSVTAEEMIANKTKIHQDYLQNFPIQDLTFAETWAIRESCIAELSAG